MYRSASRIRGHWWCRFDFYKQHSIIGTKGQCPISLAHQGDRGMKEAAVVTWFCTPYDPTALALPSRVDFEDKFWLERSNRQHSIVNFRESSMVARLEVMFNWLPDWGHIRAQKKLKASGCPIGVHIFLCTIGYHIQLAAQLRSRQRHTKDKAKKKLYL